MDSVSGRFNVNNESEANATPATTDDRRVLSVLQGNSETSPSENLAGHGNTLETKVVVDQKTRYLFLKPLQKQEYANYKTIRSTAPALMEFMPHIYGEAKVRGQLYLTRVLDKELIKNMFLM